MQRPAPAARSAQYPPLVNIHAEERHEPTTHARETEGTILGRVLCNEDGLLSPEVGALHPCDRGFTDQDKARMHDLAVRNREGVLSPAEREESFAFVNAGDMLGILKSKARRTLKIKPKKRPAS